MSDKPQGDPRFNPETDYEKKDMGVSALLLAAIGAIILTVLTMGFTVFFLDTIETVTIQARPTPLPLIELRPTPPSPRLQPNPIEDNGYEDTAEANLRDGEDDLVEMNEANAEILDGAEWIEEGSTARIPIEMAIELLAEEDAEEDPAQ